MSATAGLRRIRGREAEEVVEDRGNAKVQASCTTSCEGKRRGKEVVYLALRGGGWGVA